jgi:hypothetical protein
MTTWNDGPGISLLSRQRERVRPSITRQKGKQERFQSLPIPDLALPEN